MRGTFSCARGRTKRLRFGREREPNGRSDKTPWPASKRRQSRAHGALPLPHTPDLIHTLTLITSAHQKHQEGIRATSPGAVFAADYVLYLKHPEKQIELARVRTANSSGFAGTLSATMYTHTPQRDVPGLFGTFDKTPNQYHDPKEKNQAKRGTQYTVMDLQRSDILVYNVAVESVGGGLVQIDASSLQALAEHFPGIYAMPVTLPKTHAPLSCGTKRARADDSEGKPSVRKPRAARTPKPSTEVKTEPEAGAGSSAKQPRVRKPRSAKATEPTVEVDAGHGADATSSATDPQACDVRSSSRWKENSCHVDAAMQFVEALDCLLPRPIDSSSGDNGSGGEGGDDYQSTLPLAPAELKNGLDVDTDAPVRAWLASRNKVLAGNANPQIRAEIDTRRDEVRRCILRSNKAYAFTSADTPAFDEAVAADMDKTGSAVANIMRMLRVGGNPTFLVFRHFFKCISGKCKSAFTGLSTQQATAVYSLMQPSLEHANGDVLAAINNITTNMCPQYHQPLRRCQKCGVEAPFMQCQIMALGQTLDSPWTRPKDAPGLFLVELPESRGAADGPCTNINGATVMVPLLPCGDSSAPAHLAVEYELCVVLYHSVALQHYTAAQRETAGVWLWFDAMRDDGVGQPFDGPPSPVHKDASGALWTALLLGYGRADLAPGLEKDAACTAEKKGQQGQQVRPRRLSGIARSGVSGESDGSDESDGSSESGKSGGNDESSEGSESDDENNSRSNCESNGNRGKSKDRAAGVVQVLSLDPSNSGRLPLLPSCETNLSLTFALVRMS